MISFVNFLKALPAKKKSKDDSSFLPAQRPIPITAIKEAKKIM